MTEYRRIPVGPDTPMQSYAMVPVDANGRPKRSGKDWQRLLDHAIARTDEERSPAERNIVRTSTILIAVSMPHWSGSFAVMNPWNMPADTYLPLPYVAPSPGGGGTTWDALQKALKKRFPGCIVTPATE